MCNKLCSLKHFPFVSNAVYISVSFLSEILVAPESRVVFLDQSAVFTCETAGGTLSWIINGTQREIHLDDIRRDLVVIETIIDGGITAGTLTIPARTEYNGTRVQCAVLTFGGSAQSENVTMTIQGICHMTAQYNRNSLH